MYKQWCREFPDVTRFYQLQNGVIKSNINNYHSLYFIFGSMIHSNVSLNHWKLKPFYFYFSQVISLSQYQTLLNFFPFVVCFLYLFYWLLELWKNSLKSYRIKSNHICVTKLFISKQNSFCWNILQRTFSLYYQRLMFYIQILVTFFIQ